MSDELPFEYTLEELGDLADEIDSKAYFKLCESDLSDEEMRAELLKIVNRRKS